MRVQVFSLTVFGSSGAEDRGGQQQERCCETAVALVHDGGDYGDGYLLIAERIISCEHKTKSRIKPVNMLVFRTEGKRRRRGLRTVSLGAATYDDKFDLFRCFRYFYETKFIRD